MDKSEREKMDFLLREIMETSRQQEGLLPAAAIMQRERVRKRKKKPITKF